MKVISLSKILCLVSSLSLTAAYVSLDPFPGVVQVGETYTLSWTATDNYTYTLWLVLDNPRDYGYSWNKVSGLGSGLHYQSLNGSYVWTVPSNLSTQGDYGLWLDGFSIPFDGASYSNMTNWFKISSSSIPTTSASATLSPSPTTSVRIPVVTSGGASNENPVPSNHKSLSGGAIAGIVIGCILIIALVVGAVLFSRWRKKRSGFQQREAAARANRLAPVMQTNSPDYEMHGRTSQTIKETNV